MTIEPAPTPDAADQDLGIDDPSPTDPALQEETPVQDASGPATEEDTIFESMDYRANASGAEAPVDGSPGAIDYGSTPPTAGGAQCERTIRAHVVALDQVFFWNRLGAVQPQGMIFALRHNVVPKDGYHDLSPGHVRLRADHRPRPLVLRMNVGDCLQIDFQNLLNPTPVDDEQGRTRYASIHAVGLQVVNDIRNDGANTGQTLTPGGLVAPGGRITYTLYADPAAKEGPHLLYSKGANTGGEGDGGQIPPGLFGAINVEPRGAEWYRSQLTSAELRMATVNYTPAGQPIINYNKSYPWWSRYAGLPVLKILNRNNVIVHSDLNAIITGPGRGKFAANTYPQVAVEPNRDWPFREFTIIYHDEIGAVQAFPQFEQNGPGQLGPTLHAGRDAFAINYGAAGIGSEILANRFGVGPMANCIDCMFEEFFLSAWSVGDPAMIVDRPANLPCQPDLLKQGHCAPGQDLPTPGYKATKAFYPADPSNVHHSYINDHVKMRVIHAGPKEHHIHHLHAHQWIHTPDSDFSTYLDSQSIGPTAAFTMEIAHGGTGNRNLTVGDSIFHCHFYPHFAQGMWELWRSHDVLETGTVLDGRGRPAQGARALPDVEIRRGTPIPAIVPLPGGTGTTMANYVMPPLPQAVAQINPNTGQVQVSGTGNPGYPFFIPALSGHRPPHPPLDTEFDGGLPRHRVLDGTLMFEHHTRTDFDKELESLVAERLDEGGEFYERQAMAYHAMATHKSYRTDGTEGLYMTNGLPAQPGAPYADPCVTDRFDPQGNQIFTVAPQGRVINYQVAVFEFDMKLNKAGWHFPQSRIEALWQDVEDTRLGHKPPEPLFFRANTNDCIVFRHTNLVPRVYRLDDFQVRTPTDVIGQHIHLVKFDVTSSDGAGNGWNYEDGTFSPDEVRGRIQQINKGGGIIMPGGDHVALEPQPHPFFHVLGAQTTVQRWFADNTLSITPGGLDQFSDPQCTATSPCDRTLRTVFTHDHFSPSTHQQTGLYAGLVVEPRDSDWRNNEDGSPLGIGNRSVAPREDGGPTSFAAVILPPDTVKSFREFLLEFADFQLAYLPGGGVNSEGLAIPDPLKAINPPALHGVDLPPFGPSTVLLKRPLPQPGAEGCPTGDPAPCPEIVSSADVGTMSVNYRNEPLALRVRQPSTNTQATGTRGDLSFAYASIQRADNDLNQLGPYPPLVPDMGAFDPYTPLLRGFENDLVKVRILVGAHEEGHNFTVHGVKWLFEPTDPNSGYRNSQMMGISEHFEFVIPPVPQNSSLPFADFLYKPGASVDDQWNGLWGLARAYRDAPPPGGAETDGGGPPLATLATEAPPPYRLPNNSGGRAAAVPEYYDPTLAFPGVPGVCPASNKLPTSYNVHAVLARDVLPTGRLEFDGQNGYNFSVQDPRNNQTRTGPLNDPTAILYVREEDLTGGIYNRTRVEPLILRANAGDCIQVTLINDLPLGTLPDLPGYNALPMLVDDFNANQLVPSGYVGLHPQLVHYDVTSDDGFNVGRNPYQTVAPSSSRTYTWYAGDYSNGIFTPIEFGATNLVSSDPIKHSNKSAIGALIIEPAGFVWAEDEDQHAAATVYMRRRCLACGYDPTFREFVMLFQNDVNMRFNDGTAVPNLASFRAPDAIDPTVGIAAEDPEDSGQKALNYRTEPMWTRFNYWPGTPLNETRNQIFTNAVNNVQIGNRDPVTPIFTASPGAHVRIRVLHPNGHGRNNVFELHGHSWPEEPYTSNSQAIGTNSRAEWKGSWWGHGPSNHFDVRFEQAGGPNAVTGDYLYRTANSFQFDGGIWGIFRVGN